MRFNSLFVITLFLLLVSCQNKTQSGETSAESTQTQPSSAVDSGATIRLDYNGLPKGIDYKGMFHEAYKWFDRNGENILILSRASSSIEVKATEMTEYSNELFARSIVLDKSDHPRTVWDMYDAQLKCPFDITCDFIDSDMTDLDRDGIREVFILYKVACRSDASPARMKLIMHEGEEKYALRGNMIFKSEDLPASFYSETREIDLTKIPKAELEETMFRDWGCYENAESFKGAPPAFLEHAVKLWRANNVEIFQ
jgi:hypothetical protein